MEIKILWGEQIVARQISEVGFFLKGHHSDGKNNLIKFLEDHTKIYKTFGADIDACGMYVFTLILKFESGELGRSVSNEFGLESIFSHIVGLFSISENFTTADRKEFDQDKINILDVLPKTFHTARFFDIDLAFDFTLRSPESFDDLVAFEKNRVLKRSFGTDKKTLTVNASDQAGATRQSRASTDCTELTHVSESHASMASMASMVSGVSSVSIGSTVCATKPRDIKNTKTACLFEPSSAKFNSKGDMRDVVVTEVKKPSELHRNCDAPRV